ncbi:ATP-dependent Clp protease ATP-binding subunit [Anaerococcus prevotii]|uniref:Putative chaperone protein ClpB n=1 Tax=Anaerococcus prevotii ACS-065-V-Col13 TaxID=879305 RepID=F0GW08_9FIRM|nr:ATP-dependent Clp protease ATP-binding subunit [Anaerococcus prevotii]EGC81923.1 putative chaperone protein ClpB [Anaerococcus prevotii ACS-065-V-Col13]
MKDIYSLKASMAIKEARNLALLNKNQEVTDLHLLKSVTDQENHVLDTMLEEFSVDKDNLADEITKAIGKLRSNDGLSKLYFSRDYQRALLLAKENAKKRYAEKITTSHLFLAFFDLGKTTSKHILEKVGLRQEKCEEYLVNKEKEVETSERFSEKIGDLIDKYGIDLTKRAKEGKIDPVIGMDEEVDRLSEILTRRIKNNPILIGEPGVGKSAVVEGLALKIAQGDVVDFLKDKIIFSLNISSVLAGTGLRGEFESRVKDLMDIVTSFEGKIILFIDEIHTIVGAGSSSGGIDISNIIKPKLSRGEITIIGATTVAEYRSHIEKDGALERRFQKILIKEPSLEESYDILRGIKTNYENFHNLIITDEAIKACVDLSDRYITDRKLPDKAIDLMDEAASMLKNKLENTPDSLDELREDILELEESLQLKDNDKNKSKLDELKKLYENNLEIKQEETEDLRDLRRIRSDIRELEFIKKRLLNEDKFEEYTKITKVKLPELRKEEKSYLNKKYEFVKIEKLEENHIKTLISRITKIPVEDLNQDRKEKILNIDKALGKKVIGQREAVEKISNAIIRTAVGMKNRHKPIGTFLFTGNTGLGKTYLAKVLADTLYEGEESLIRFDMSEYMDSNSTTKFIGAPPGFVGYEEGGQLTEKVRINPYSVILFDEIEKANKQIFDILLQILDEGRLTDNRGITIDFTNTIIILTSNILAGEDDSDLYKHELYQYFKPEFINRLDAIVKFNTLSYEDLMEITKIYLEEVKNDFEEIGVNFAYTNEVIEKIVDLSDYEEFGAREIRRVVDDKIVTMVSRKILQDDLDSTNVLTIMLEDDEFSFSIM